jgi:hypothetical protein
MQSVPARIFSPDTEGSFNLFTSCSTETPKAILLGQQGIIYYAASKRTALGLGQVKGLQQASTGFDMAFNLKKINALVLGTVWMAIYGGGLLEGGKKYIL